MENAIFDVITARGKRAKWRENYSSLFSTFETSKWSFYSSVNVAGYLKLEKYTDLEI